MRTHQRLVAGFLFLRDIYLRVYKTFILVTLMDSCASSTGCSNILLNHSGGGIVPLP